MTEHPLPPVTIFSNSECSSNYLTIEELLCHKQGTTCCYIVFLDHFRPYLLGTPFTIRTNHGSLTWIQKFKQPEGQIARWLQKLQEYQFTACCPPTW